MQLNNYYSSYTFFKGIKYSSCYSLSRFSTLLKNKLHTSQAYASESVTAFFFDSNRANVNNTNFMWCQIQRIPKITLITTNIH